jgi:hypothetical protein
VAWRHLIHQEVSGDNPYLVSHNCYLAKLGDIQNMQVENIHTEKKKWQKDFFNKKILFILKRKITKFPLKFFWNFFSTFLLWILKKGAFFLLAFKLLR